MKMISRFVAALLVMFCIAIQANAQQDQTYSGNSNYLEQIAPRPQQAIDPPLSSAGQAYWGFDLGLTYNWYSGGSNFFWPVSDAANNILTYLRFDNMGSGIGGIFGVKAAVPLSQSIDLEGKLRYLTNYTSNTEQQPLPVITQQGAQQNVSNQYSLTLTNLDFAALLHFALSDRWYAAAGFSISGLLSNSFTATQTLPAGFTYTDVNGNPTAVTDESGTFAWQNTFSTTRADLQVGAGTIFPLGTSAPVLDLEALLSIPLTEWMSANGQNTFNSDADFFTQRYAALGENVVVAHPTYPKLWYVSLTLGIRFPFEHAEEEPAAYESNEVPGNTHEGVGPDGKVALRGTVKDSKTGKPVDATMTVVDLTNNQVVATDRTHDGNYSVRVPAPGKYSVTADADGYLFGTAYFQVDNQGRILARDNNIELSPTSGGRTRLLVFFDFNSATLKAESYPELNRAVHLMEAVPSMKVQIAGYTDSIGSDEYNRQLSQQRAEAVRDYLVQHGIAANRITAHGYGKESPIADNGTEEGRAENRRVEFVVMSK